MGNNYKIVSLALGTISGSSTDAVNGSQLYGTAASTAGALGGGTVVNADGSVSKPTYVLKGASYNNVGGALTSLQGQIPTPSTTASSAVPWAT